MIGAGDRGGVSADRGCKLLAMLAWLIISVPRAPKGSSRFRSSGRNFWPVATALRPRGKHKIPQKVSGLRNGIMPAAAGRRGGARPLAEQASTPETKGPQLRHNSLEIDYTPRSLLGESIYQHSPRLSQLDDWTTGSIAAALRSAGAVQATYGAPGRPSKRGKPRPRGQRLEAAVTDRFGGFGRAGLGGFERAAFLLWKLLARRAPVGAGPIHKDRRCPSLFWRYSFTAMKPTTFDSSCICRMILPTSSRGSLASDRRMR